MLNWMKSMLKKHWDVILYLVFGGLTTLVNFVVYYPLFNLAQWPASVCTAIAWVVSVVFAFLTNKPIVFKSMDWSWKVVGPELAGFVGCRVFSGLLELGIIALTVDFLGWDGNLMKIIVAVAVVIINYIGSKLLFKKKDAHSRKK